MDEIIYEAIDTYYNILKKTGYYPYSNVVKLLILCFYRDLVFEDYRGLISRENYHEIERALNCLFGSTCLIPYSDYLKMGKLRIGDMSELSQRIKDLEDTNVLKAFIADGTGHSDIVITSEEEE